MCRNGSIQEQSITGNDVIFEGILFMFNRLKTKKWTFIVLRDNRRSSMQFSVNRHLLLLASLLLTGLIVASMWLAQAYHKKTHAHKQAVTQIGEQEEIIESLHNDLVSLSVQAKEVQEKMKSLKALEEEIHQLTDTSDADESISRSLKSKDDGHFFTLAGRSDDKSEGASSGGTSYEVSKESINTLTAQTKNNLDHIQNNLPFMRERLKEARSNAKAYQETIRATPSIWPTKSKRVTSEFAYRQDPFTGKRSYHSGIDIGGRMNDPVYATADGEVTATGYHPSMGNYVTINHHASGMQTRYLHLSKILVSKGDHVQKGERIALLGSTGRSTGPHLHYEVMKDDKLTNPRPYMGATGNPD